MKPENTGNNQDIRDEKGRFKPGCSGNPAGKPPGAGMSLKTFLKNRFANMDDEEKADFLKKISPDLQWQMAEGRPAQDNVLKGDEDAPIKHEFVWKQEQSQSTTPQENGQENSTNQENDGM